MQFKRPAVADLGYCSCLRDKFTDERGVIFSDHSALDLFSRVLNEYSMYFASLAWKRDVWMVLEAAIIVNQHQKYINELLGM